MYRNTDTTEILLRLAQFTGQFVLQLSLKIILELIKMHHMHLLID